MLTSRDALLSRAEKVLIVSLNWKIVTPSSLVVHLTPTSHLDRVANMSQPLWELLAFFMR